MEISLKGGFNGGIYLFHQVYIKHLVIAVRDIPKTWRATALISYSELYFIPAETTRINCQRRERPCMAERETYCPQCDETRGFYRVASTTMHLGTKVKWHCPECDYGFVRIDGAVDTSTA